MRGLEQIPWLYDPMCWCLEATGLGRWRAWLTSGARGRTLDVGCGTGRNLPLLPAGCIGVDPAREPLLKARERAPSALLVRASAEALPFKARSFETVVSGLVFCSVPDAPRGLAEVRRVLAPGGSLRMLEHVRSESRAAAWLQDFLLPVWTRLSGGCHNNRDTVGTVRRRLHHQRLPRQRHHAPLRRALTHQTLSFGPGA